MGPARRRFHGVPWGPRVVARTRWNPLEPLDREDFLGEFFFFFFLTLFLDEELRQFRVLS